MWSKFDNVTPLKKKKFFFRPIEIYSEKTETEHLYFYQIG